MKSEVWRDREAGCFRWRCGLRPCTSGDGASTHHRAHADLDEHLRGHHAFGYQPARQAPVRDLSAGRPAAGALTLPVQPGSVIFTTRNT